MIVVTWGSATDAGRVRAQNQDAVLASPPVFVVADGMGGHAGGEVASRIAVDAFGKLAGREDLVGDDVADTLTAVNEEILAASREDPSLSDMGTTASGLALVSEQGEHRWLAFNIGDSRIYRLSGGVLRQVSVDHSYVQDLVSAGRLAPEQARFHPERNIVTRVLGLPDHGPADYWMLVPQPGDRYLLCTDGLNDELDDDQLRALLERDAAPEEIARELVHEAMLAGGRDNITALVLDVLVESSAEIDPGFAPERPAGRADDDDAGPATLVQPVLGSPLARPRGAELAAAEEPLPRSHAGAHAAEATPADPWSAPFDR